MVKLNKFKLDKDFKKYVYKYVTLLILVSFIIFSTLLFNFELKMAGLIMYIFLFISFFVMLVDLKLQYKLFKIEQEIKNIKSILRGIK